MAQSTPPASARFLRVCGSFARSLLKKGHRRLPWGLRRLAQGSTALAVGLAAPAALAFDLQFNSVTDVDPAPTNGVLEYTVQIENSGFTTATDVRTVFAIPTGASVEGGALALPSAANANCSVSGGFVVCAHGDMAGTGSGAGTPPIVFTLKFRAPAALPAPPNVRLRGAIGRGAPPLGTAQADPAALFGSGSSFWTGDTNENNNAQAPLQQTTLENNVDLSVAVSASTNPVVSGGRLTHTVTVTNNGPTSNPSPGVRVFSTLPAGATYVPGSATGAGWVFSGPSAGVLTATRGALALAVGASVSFTYEVTVAIASGTLTNNAEVDTDRGVSGALLDNNPNNNTASVATGVTPSADLALTKSLTSGSGPFVAGATLGMRLAPRNLGLSVASSVVVRDVLPAQHTLAASFPLPPSTQAFGSYTCRTNAANQDDLDQADAGRAARTILRCTRAALPVGDVENIDFNVVTASGLSGSVTNTASISSATADPSSANNSSNVSYTVLLDGADIELVSFNKLPTRVAATGGPINNAVRVRNVGPRAVDGNLQVFVTLSAGETLVSTGSGWSCAPEAGGMRCTYGGSYPVAVGATSGGGSFPDLLFVTQANAAGALNSEACVGGSGGSAEATVGGFTAGTTTDFNTGNDCSGLRGVTATSQLSDLVMSKTTSTASGGDKVVSASETSATFTLTVTNQGPVSTPGVVVQDYLPGHVDGATVVSICGYSGAGSCTPPTTANFPATIGGWVCTLAAERVVCSSGDTVLGVGAANAQTFVVQMSGRLRDSLSTAAFSGCSSSGQFCNQAVADIESGRAGASLDPNPNNNAGQDTLVVHAAANIQTESKTFTPAQAQVGVDTEYTINFRNPVSSRSDLPAVASPGAGVPAGVVFIDTFSLAANDPGFVLKSATIVSGAACTVSAITGGVVAAAAAGGTSYSTTGGASGTVRIECPAVTMPRNTDRQVRIVVRPNIGAAGPLVNTASFRFVDSGNNAVAASGATYDFNTDSSAGDDTKTASVNFVLGQVDLRVENTDLQDPAGWDAGAVGTSPGASDIVYRVQVRNGGPSLASNVRVDYTITPPPGGTIRFIGDEGGTAVTMTSGAAAPQRCAVLTGTNPVVAPATLTLRCTTPGFGFTPNIDGAIVQGTGAGDGAFLNIRLRFESTPAPTGSTVQTLAVVSAAETELDASNNSEAEVTTVRTTADLALTKTGFTTPVPVLPSALPAAVNTVGLGQPFNWVLDLVNNGPGDSLSVDRSGSSPLNGTGTVITDTLPAGVIVTGPITWQKTGSSGFPGAVASGSGTCALAGLAVTCNVGDVGSGGRVRVTLPVRWDTWPGGSGAISDPQSNNAAASSQTTDPVPSNNAAVHVVRVTRSSLAGVVFEDRDRAGANSGTPQSPAVDPPLAGVTVALRATGGVDAYGISFAPRTTTTDGNGAYAFTDLPAGTFEVLQLQPSGYGNSPGDPTAAAAGVSPSLGGSYVAQGADPAGAPLPAGANSRYTGVLLGVQQDGVRYNFPEVQQAAAISGTVFLDRNRDGSPGGVGAGEPGISSVSLGLYPAGTTCPASGALPGGALQTVSTDSNGVYSFNVGVQGTAYVICQQQPAGYGDRTPQPGSGNGTPAANQINVAALGAGGSSGNNFPEVLASLAGQVFADFSVAGPALANNGVRDAGEPGIGSNTAAAGVPVTLSGTPTAGPSAGTPLTLTTHTAADGSYRFEGLFPGSYTLTEGAIPAPLGSFTDGINTAGPVSGGGTPGTAGAVGDNNIRNIVLAAGAQGTDNNFAELPPAATISGTVFLDRNRDGSPGGVGAGEPGISGVSLGLYPAGTTCPASGALPGGALQTVSTDSNGAYSFSVGVQGTAYVICQQQPAGYGDRTPQPGSGNGTPGANQINVAALGAGGSSGNNFPEVLASLAGQVFADFSAAGPALANNGVRDAGEPGIGSDTAAAGVLITLSGTPTAGPTAGTPLTLTTHTAADGSYRFDGLFPGSYTLTEGAIPAPLGSFTDGINTAGPVSGGGTAGTAGAVGDNNIRNIVLAAGAQGTGNNFAELPPAVRIAGVVYVDANRDGALTAADAARVGGVTLRLVSGLACTGTVLASTTTDGNGAYSFARAQLAPPAVLIPGAAYSVCETQPAGFDDGSVNPGSGAAAGGANHIVISALPATDSLGNNFGELTPLAVPTPDLVVSKTLAPATFTEQNRGSYSITVRNVGAAASSGVYTVTDTLPAGITAVAAPAQGSSGWACSVAGQTLTCTSSAVIAAGAANPNAITLDVQVGQNLCSAGYPCSVNNVVSVTGGGEPPAAQPTAGEPANPPLCTTPATQNVCRLPTPIQQSGGVSGLVWLDADHDRRFTGSADVRQSGFIVELYQAGTLLRTATTDAQGQYQFLGLVPGSNYEIRFRDAATGAYYGRPVSTDPAGGNDPRASGVAGVVPDAALRGFTVPGGNAVRVNQNLPLDPSGVVYDSQTRQPVGGAVVELLGPGGQPVPAQCVLGGANSITTATTGAGVVPGAYAFWLVAPAPVGCPGDGNYTLRVTPPAGYINAGVPSAGSLVATSNLIPAQAGAVQVPASCQGYVQGAPCAVQNQTTAPTGAQPTPYFFTVPLRPNTPAGFVDIVNNHIPLDPLLGTRFVISKQASRATVEVGDAVSYTITVKHLGGAALADVRVNDRLPAGFRYVPGTFRIGTNLRSDPAGAPGPNLRFDVGALPVNGQVSFSYVTRAGVGAQQGDGINTAQATAGSGAQAVQSNVAKARVRITGGVFGADACVVGKVYVDCNNNQVQGREELGIPGVRLLLQDGTNFTTDSEGKYSICGLPPRTHVLKADPLTLPRGSRLVTSSNRNAGDAHSIFIDLKNGELQRADFIEGSCSNTVLEQVKARRTQGEVRAVETEKKGGPALKFEGKAPNAPQQGTDSVNQQPAVRPRENAPAPRPPVKEGRHEQNVPVPELPAASSNTQRQ